MLDSDMRLPGSDDSAPAHVGFLLIPDFALLPYASAIEPLRAANRLSGRPLTGDRTGNDDRYLS